jgi:hypothetical protein
MEGRVANPFDEARRTRIEKRSDISPVPVGMRVEGG